jgi:hypothetical protein
VFQVSGRIVRQNPRVVFRAIDDGGVLLHLDTTAYHRVNRIGASIWSEIGRGRTEDGIVVALREELSDAPPCLEDDVVRYVDALASRGLITVDSS